MLWKNPEISDAERRRKDLKWIMYYSAFADEIFNGKRVGEGKSDKRIGGIKNKTLARQVFAFLRLMELSDHCTSKRLIQIVMSKKLPKPSETDPILRAAQDQWLYKDRTAICVAIHQILKKSKSASFDRARHFDNEENRCPNTNTGDEDWVYYNADTKKNPVKSNKAVDHKVADFIDTKEKKNANARRPEALREKIAEKEIEEEVI